MDKNKVIQNAQKFIQKGQLDKAIREYEKVLQADANDVRTRLKIGDLHAKKGDNRAAAETYVLVAEAYGNQGFFLKAVAVYKQILKLDPNRVEVNLKLAELYHQLGLMQDAMAQYQAVSSYYERTGNTRASFDTMQRMLDLDPDNVASRIKLAEMYSKEGMTGEAIQEFRNAAAYLKERNRIDDYVRVCERLIFHDATDIELTREIANVYLTKGDTKRALAKLQVCFKADPQDVETLHLLAKAFLDLGQSNKTISVYKELAKIYGDQGQVDEQREAWGKVLELSPQDAEGLAATGQSVPAAAPVAAAPSAGPPPGASGGGAQAGGDVSRLLTETDVYVKYGLRDKAIEHLKKVFAIDPNNLSAHERAKDLFVEASNLEAAGEELVRLIALTKGQDVERAKAYLAELVSTAPHLPEVKGFVAELGQPEVEQTSFLDGPPSMEALGDDEEFIVAGDEEEFLVSDDDDFEEDDETFAVEDSFENEEQTGAELSVDLSLESDLDEDIDEDEFLEVDETVSIAASGDDDFLVDDLAAATAQGTDEDFDDDEAQPTQSIELDEVPDLQAAREAYAAAEDPFEPTGDFETPMDLDDGLLEPVIEESGTELLEDSMGIGMEVAPAEAAVGKSEEEIADELEEAEFFIQQGLPDEAREVVSNILADYPEHPEALRLVAQLEADEGGDEDEGAEPSLGLDGEGVPEPEGGAFDDFDLAGELADELADLEEESAAAPLDSLQVSADDVFAEFKKGVAATVSTEDADTHYDLGIAYREMGLTADAVGEFELSSARPSMRVQSLSMIGTCYRELGDSDAAIEAFKRILSEGEVSTDAEMATYYELGEIYEGLADPDEAIFYLRKVAGLDATFREVSEKLVALGVAPGGGKSASTGGGKSGKVGYV